MTWIVNIFLLFCPFSSLSFKKIRCFHLFCNCVDFVSILFYISSLSQFEIRNQVILSNVRHVVIIFSLITLIRGEQSNHIYGKIDYWAKRTKVETHEIKCFNLKQKFICVAPDSKINVGYDVMVKWTSQCRLMRQKIHDKFLFCLWFGFFSKKNV